MPPPSPSSIERPDLRDRVVLVTGATGGLGRVLSLALAGCGATLVLHARVVRKLEALYDDIVARGGPEPILAPLDFTRATVTDYADVASAIHAQCGRLD